MIKFSTNNSINCGIEKVTVLDNGFYFSKNSGRLTPADKGTIFDTFEEAENQVRETINHYLAELQEKLVTQDFSIMSKNHILIKISKLQNWKPTIEAVEVKNEPRI